MNPAAESTASPSRPGRPATHISRFEATEPPGGGRFGGELVRVAEMDKPTPGQRRAVEGITASSPAGEVSAGLLHSGHGMLDAMKCLAIAIAFVALTTSAAGEEKMTYPRAPPATDADKRDSCSANDWMLDNQNYSMAVRERAEWCHRQPRTTRRKYGAKH